MKANRAGSTPVTAVTSPAGLQGYGKAPSRSHSKLQLRVTAFENRHLAGHRVTLRLFGQWQESTVSVGHTVEHGPSLVIRVPAPQGTIVPHDETTGNRRPVAPQIYFSCVARCRAEDGQGSEQPSREYSFLNSERRTLQHLKEIPRHHLEPKNIEPWSLERREIRLP